MHTIKTTQKLPISIDKAWEFFSSPKNLSLITPDNLGFEIKSELPDEIYPGLFIQYTVKPLLKVPVLWVTEITHIKKPWYFVDEQRVGPYRIWHHQHHFKEIKGGIEMTDIVDYLVPFGFIGRIMEPIVVRQKLKKIFDYRQAKLTELFGHDKNL